MNDQELGLLLIKSFLFTSIGLGIVGILFLVPLLIFNIKLGITFFNPYIGIMKHERQFRKMEQEILNHLRGEQ